MCRAASVGWAVHVASGFNTVGRRQHVAMLLYHYWCCAPFVPCRADSKAPDELPNQYLLQFESSDISRLRADVQSLGFTSLVT